MADNNTSIFQWILLICSVVLAVIIPLLLLYLLFNNASGTFFLSRFLTGSRETYRQTAEADALPSKNRQLLETNIYTSTLPPTNQSKFQNAEK
jgi:hypothetical protein